MVEVSTAEQSVPVPARVRIRASVTVVRLAWLIYLPLAVVSLIDREPPSTWFRGALFVAAVIAAIATGVPYFHADRNGITRMHWWRSRQTLAWADVHSVEVDFATGWEKFVQPGTRMHVVGNGGERIAVSIPVRGREQFEGRRAFVAMASARGIPVNDHRSEHAAVDVA